FLLLYLHLTGPAHPATYPLSLHDALPNLEESQAAAAVGQIALAGAWSDELSRCGLKSGQVLLTLGDTEERRRYLNARATISTLLDRKSTRLNSSHVKISYAVFCLKKKNNT